MEERKRLQKVFEGRDDGSAEMFIYNYSDEIFIGLDAYGLISYYIPNGDHSGALFIVMDQGEGIENEFLETVTDISMPRFEKMKNYSPVFCESLEDGFSSSFRLDRGAIVLLGNNLILAKDCVMPNFMQRVQKEGVNVFGDNYFYSQLEYLINRFSSINNELDSFKGFSTLEEIWLTMQESLPYIKLGLKISRWFE